jgi:hypothetical protein
MKKIIIIFIVAFTAGYFSHSAIGMRSASAEGATLTTSTNSQIDCSKTSVDGPKFTRAPSDPNEQQNQTVHSSKSDSVQSAASVPESGGNNYSYSDDSVGNTENKYPNEISDDEIDKILPAPFNQRLKNHHGTLREKYKKYAETSQPLDWDKNMQNKLNDAIFSNPYSKFLKVKSLQCKANLCEIQVFETKSGVWSYIHSEMQLQDWWDIGGASASGFGTDVESTKGWYVLLSKR